MIAISMIVIGITAMASQIIFMRELLIVSCGNELSISFILASWFLGGAIGSALLGWFADRIRYKITVFGLLQIVLGLLLPFEIIAIRLVRNVFGIAPGQIMPLSSMLASSLVILIPICALLGFLFALGCRIYRSTGNVYVLEGIGAVIGGSVAGCFLVKLLDPVSIMALLSALNAANAIFLFRNSNESRIKAPLSIFAAIIFIAISSAFVFKGWDTLERNSLKEEWQGYDLITSKNSVYGNIALTKRLDQFSFFDNGLHLYSIPDRERAEESVHFTLLEHPDPRDVLLIGGGVGGALEEILKHPVDRVDYAELDPLIVNIAEKYLPEKYSSWLSDKRVVVDNADGRFFVKMQGRRQYDCVIMNVGDPSTAQLNRFYTYEFFEEVKRILKPGGMLSFGLTSSESYINKELAELLSSVYATLKKSFKDVVVIPGETAYFIATNTASLLTCDYNVLMDNLRMRRIDLQYVREYYLSSRMAPQKIAYIENILKGRTPPKINYDFRPVSYYYDVIFWTTKFRDSVVTRILKGASEKAVWTGLFIIYGLILSAGTILLFKKRSFERITLISVAGAGFSSMAIQIIVLLAFQIIYGYLFYKLSVILTAFMVGLVAGGMAAMKVIAKFKNYRTAILPAQFAFLIYPLILPAVFQRLASSGSGAVLFIILPLLAGFIGGFQFPLANKIYTGNKKDIGMAAGLTYGVDLAGACLGALSAGIFLIPVLGMGGACLALGGLNFAILVVLVFSFRRGKL